MTTPILIIDPGHGGTDPGAMGNGLREKDLTLQISTYQSARFHALGVPVVLTRTTDTSLTPSQRTKLVRDSGATYCISNHINSGGGEGVEAIYSIFAKDTLPKLLAQAVADCGQKIRKIYTKVGPGGKDYFFMHRDTGKVETIILEYGFIDHPVDAKKLRDNWKTYAEAVVKAFCGYIGVPYIPPAKPVEKVSIELNGSLLPVQGYLRDGVSWLPIRAVAEAVGATVEWNATTRQVKVNGQDLTESIENGTAYAPARELAAILALDVEWEQATKTVKMKKRSA
ncbi:N-acetylmuramoyl-L-alanine amidase [Brevibacillus sedimenti]|uniref:N-acetylmuramoyl-L-alanine amidase n=1 Tax=Brevibacillus sedimenti TaxID=2613334 RepID=UPI001E5685F6|nr:N-acetylmuramoyl-L-alanine amidase [Anoxybacillus sediminis]